MFKEIIITELSALLEKEVIEKNVFKVRAYRNVISQLKTLDKVESMECLCEIKGIGKKIYEKITEIFETGKLRSAENARKSSNLELYRDLMKIHGIGATKAKELVESGIDSIERLECKLKKDESILNNQQKIGLKYYDDINSRIPMKEMEKHDTYLQQIIKSIDEDILISVVGSYRRKVKDCGDIDILISFNRESSKEERNVLLNKVVLELKRDKYIKETLALGNKKCMSVVKLKRYKTNRRLDILITSIEEYPFALLYFTGSQSLNIFLRQIAINKNLCLNEYSLTKNKVKICLKSEEEIFNYLGYQYIKPEHRTNEKEIKKWIL